MPYKLNNTLCVAVVLIACSLFINLGKTPIYILDEARNAQCAWEMKEKKELIVPSFNNELRGQKPPLHYYFMMAAYSVFGKTPFAARFFSAIVGSFTFLAVYYFVKKFSGTALALATVVVMALSAHLLFEFRLSVPDPYLILFQTLTLFCFFDFFKTSRPGLLYAAAVFAALSTLAKGPVAVALPGLIFILFITTYKKWQIIFTWHLIGCFILYLLIALPWFLQVHKQTAGAFTNIFFFEHNLNRFGSAMEGHGGFPGLALLMVIAGLLPGSVFLFTKKETFKNIWKDSFLRFCLVTTAVVIFFYSLSATILPNYPMICYPFAACVMAYAFLQINNYRRYLIALLCLYIIYFVAAYVALGAEKPVADMQYWAFVFLVPIVFLSVAIVIEKTKKQAAVYSAAAGIAICNCLVLWFAYPQVYSKNPVTENIRLVKSSNAWGSFGAYNPSVNFYIDKPVKHLNDSLAIDSFIRQHANAILIGRKEDLHKLNHQLVKIAAKHKDLFENPTTVFLVPSPLPFTPPPDK